MSFDTTAERMANFVEYRPRLFASLGLWQEGSWRFKVYGIQHNPERNVDGIIAAPIQIAARNHVRTRLGEAAGYNHYQVGFVILHQGVAGNWLLLHWWADNDICCRVLSRAPLELPERFEIHAGAVMACVWELAVIEFERRAWIEKVLCPGGSIDTYLQMRLPAGKY